MSVKWFWCILLRRHRYKYLGPQRIAMRCTRCKDVTVDYQELAKKPALLESFVKARKAAEHSQRRYHEGNNE